MNTNINFNDFEADVEYAYDCFENYLHIKRKFINVEEFFGDLSYETSLGDFLKNVIYSEKTEQYKFKIELYKITKEFFQALENSCNEATFFEVYETYTQSVFHLYNDYDPENLG